jgi:dihydrofolate reductase
MKIQQDSRSILDVACGTGLHAVNLSEWFEVDGIDINREFIDIASDRNKEGTFECHDMTNFGLNKQYDVVMCLFMFKGKDEEIFIIGGEEIYKMFLPYSNKLYLTTIEEDFEGDTYFPSIDLVEWKLTKERKGKTDANNPYEHIFRIYYRDVQNSFMS